MTKKTVRPRTPAKLPRPTQSQLKRAQAAVAAVGASPIDVQVCFLDGLIGHPEEARKFLDNPQKYAVDSGVLLDPQLVQDIIATVVLGADANRLAGRLSPGALRDVMRMRERPNQGVMNGAATACTLGTGAALSAATNARDLQRVKGLGTEGVRLPGGRTLRLPGDIRGMLVTASNAVAVYATSTTTGAALTVGRTRGGAIR